MSNKAKGKDTSVRAFCKEKVGWTDGREVRDGRVRARVVRMHCVHVRNCLRTNFNRERERRERRVGRVRETPCSC